MLMSELKCTFLLCSPLSWSVEAAHAHNCKTICSLEPGARPPIKPRTPSQWDETLPQKAVPTISGCNEPSSLGPMHVPNLAIMSEEDINSGQKKNEPSSHKRTRDVDAHTNHTMSNCGAPPTLSLVSLSANTPTEQLWHSETEKGKKKSHTKEKRAQREGKKAHGKEKSCNLRAGCAA